MKPGMFFELWLDDDFSRGVDEAPFPLYDHGSQAFIKEAGILKLRWDKKRARRVNIPVLFFSASPTCNRLILFSLVNLAVISSRLGGMRIFPEVSMYPFLKYSHFYDNCTLPNPSQTGPAQLNRGSMINRPCMSMNPYLPEPSQR